jgi:mono/diheme cytochrome c family protein
MNNKLILGLGAAVAALVAFIFLQPTEPPTPQSQMREPSTTIRTEGDDTLAKVKLPAELSLDAQIGKRGFEAKCAVCHGVNAAGQDGVAPPLIHTLYRPGHHSDRAFVGAAQNGVIAHHWGFGNMPPVQGLTDADILYITRYIRELQRENGIN